MARPARISTRYLFIVHLDGIVTSVWMANGEVRTLAYPPGAIRPQDTDDCIWLDLTDTIKLPKPPIQSEWIQGLPP